ncbi:hypothetical protein Pst134EA_027154 [Puccinia striiformis f. sp. tritici]|uniref:hypothetical protein n=1 Tax=Puccinia striiformis f. sp. tritici TaxID=168172 RepID=UPI00200771D7|nr:hypothetical protein Pst134EA_027154 [Puccinia striiformis f. sp. tritici]KAH9450457.1 hypothetical protein Pst134EA_027154 [Puccinia striiformis f. sp. tritici]
MALAIYAHTTDETTAVTKLSIYEPGLISSLSELIKFEIGGDGLVGDTQAHSSLGYLARHYNPAQASTVN